MPAIRFSGMASGLPPNIVDQLMDAERIPVKTMEVAKAKDEDKLKLITDLESKINDVTKNLSELVGTKGFTNTKLLSGDPSIIDGTVDPANATTGQWQIEVMQLAQKPGALSNGFPDRDNTQIGTGYLKFKTNEGTKEVYIGGKTSTLDGVVGAINNSNIGMRASVLNDRKDAENPFKILITGLATGSDNQVMFPSVYMLDGDSDFYFDAAKQSQNAKIKVDGFEMEVPDNIIKDVIPGVTLDLKQSAPGREIRVAVKEDMEVISGKIKSFVEAYNGVLTFIQGQNKIQKDKDGRQRLGPMGGDGMLRTMESGLRRLIQSPVYGVPSDIQRVAELGIEFARNGSLNFNAERFNSKLQASPQNVAGFLRGDGFQVGFVPAVKREVSALLDSSSGPISNRKRGIQQKIDSTNQRIETKERQLTRREEALRRQFSDLEGKMSKLQQQGAQVGAIGSSLPQFKQG